MQESDAFSFVKSRLIEIFRLNTTPVSIESLTRHFKIKSEHSEILPSLLDALLEEGVIEKDKKGIYKPVTAFSDILVLVNSIHPSQQKSEKYHDFKISGLPEDMISPIVRVPRTLIKKYKHSGNLASGEKIAVLAKRKNGTELHAKRILGGFSKLSRPVISGKFNKCAEGEDPTITVKELGKDLKLRVEVTDSIPEHKVQASFIISPYFNPLNPAVRFVSGARWDPLTGKSITSIIAEKYALQYKHPRGAVYKANKAISREITFDGREDLTHEKILVIDPIDAKDHDDGVLIERTAGGYRTLVVVSDIPFYVRSNSKLDKIARDRGFTHYFPDTTFHMFPENLVKQASLSEGELKPVIFFEQFYDLDGDKVGPSRIGSGIIGKQKQITYDDFDIKVRREPFNFAAYNELGTMMVSQMRSKRIIFDTDDYGRQHSFSQMLVSAMMIEANAAASEFLLARNIPFPSRVHSGNDNPYVFQEFKAKIESWGYELPQSVRDMNYDVLKNLLQEAQKRGDKERLERTIRNDYLDLAVYSPIKQGHFGLELNNYAHATSPIRRYPDIRVLRGIHTALGNHALGLSKKDLEDLNKVCEEANHLQNIQVRAARDSAKFHAVLSLYSDEGHYLKVQLQKIDKYHVEIVIPARGGLRGHIPINKLPESWATSKDGKSLIFNGKNKIYVGESLKIKVLSVEPDKAIWTFDLIEPSKQSRAVDPQQRGLHLVS